MNAEIIIAIISTIGLIVVAFAPALKELPQQIQVQRNMIRQRQKSEEIALEQALERAREAFLVLSVISSNAIALARKMQILCSGDEYEGELDQLTTEYKEVLRVFREPAKPPEKGNIPMG